MATTWMMLIMMMVASLFGNLDPAHSLLVAPLTSCLA